MGQAGWWPQQQHFLIMLVFRAMWPIWVPVFGRRHLYDRRTNIRRIATDP